MTVSELLQTLGDITEENAVRRHGLVVSTINIEALAAAEAELS